MGMNESGLMPQRSNLKELGLEKVNQVFWNLSPAELVEDSIVQGEGILTNTGALSIETGEFTGRSPKDKFIVKDEKTNDTIWWGDVNIAFDPQKFDALHQKMTQYLAGKDIYVRDASVCADPKYTVNVRVVTELPWSNLFAYNMFLRPSNEELKDFNPEWSIICVPSFKADSKTDGTRQHNFAVINFSKKIVLIGGTGYTGEIKKGMFTILNYILPQEQKVLSMHCSANIGKDGDTAIFFGLSGTGKTTLSADPLRKLIGDDEHAWSDHGVFNFEGGCYAKCIDLTEEKEPQIFKAIKFGALLENVGFYEETSEVDFTDSSITENTRVSYPLHYIDNAVEPSVGGLPKNIFFLTCDAHGVLPPISKLTPSQAMYYFISGYTAKVAGTEAGITEPQTVFSACFGAPFLPLHPTKYAEMLGEKLKKHQVNVWLINTGWSAGPYGVGKRISLKYTRAMITAALNGSLENVSYETHKVFGLSIPTTCSDVPSEILNPENTWTDKTAYETKANWLSEAFNKNFEKYSSFANQEILAAAPKTATKV